MSKESKNLFLFFVFTFAWTWAFYLPIAISGNSPYQMPWMIFLILGGAGPSIVGVALVLITYNREQRGDYWRRCFSCKRIGWLWWLVIFLIFPTIFAISILIDVFLGGALPGMEQLKSLMANPMLWPLTAFISFMSGPWSEEFGWRGYALEPMLERFGLIRGSIFLGVVWSVWHLPLYLMPATWHGQMGFKLTGFWLFLLFSIALSLIMTWIFRNTNRSILSAILLHFTSNFTGQLLAPSSDRLEVIRTILMLVVGLAACIIMSHKTEELSRNFGNVKKGNPALPG
jgi:membrane protease YdiL (CAAX protease family)